MSTTRPGAPLVSTYLPPPSSLSDYVVQALRDSIAEGDLAPGEDLPETEIATQLGVSRGPVREALASLEREGLVELRRHRSARVVQLTSEDAEEVFTLRLALERLAVERAARLAEPVHLAALDDALQKLAGLTPTSSPREAATADLEFHDAIYAASGHGRLQRAWETLRPQAYMFLLSRNLGRADFAARAVELHTPLRAVIAEHQPEAAVAAVEAHLRGAYLRLRETLSAEMRDQ